MPLRVPLVEYAYFETVSLLAKRLFRLAVYTKTSGKCTHHNHTVAVMKVALPSAFMLVITAGTRIDSPFFTSVMPPRLSVMVAAPSRHITIINESADASMVLSPSMISRFTSKYWHLTSGVA